MADRKKLVAGNWKMNGLRAEGVALAQAIAQRARTASALSCELLICPPATLLAPVAATLAGTRIMLGGQDCHPAAKGAFTGDISAEMLADAGCSHVILGHSERRHGHRESDALVCGKVAAARRAGLAAILCVGETMAERQQGEALAVVASQLACSIPENLERDQLIIAYEPVWAIGTGLTCALADIAAMHAAIRAQLTPDVRILYGGSVNPGNAASILGLADVDGGLVGGASLDAQSFWAIAESCG